MYNTTALRDAKCSFIWMKIDLTPGLLNHIFFKHICYTVSNDKMNEWWIKKCGHGQIPSQHLPVGSEGNHRKHDWQRNCRVFTSIRDLKINELLLVGYGKDDNVSYIFQQQIQTCGNPPKCFSLFWPSLEGMQQTNIQQRKTYNKQRKW